MKLKDWAVLRGVPRYKAWRVAVKAGVHLPQQGKNSKSMDEEEIKRMDVALKAPRKSKKKIKPYICENCGHHGGGEVE